MLSTGDLTSLLFLCRLFWLWLFVQLWLNTTIIITIRQAIIIMDITMDIIMDITMDITMDIMMIITTTTTAKSAACSDCCILVCYLRFRQLVVIKSLNCVSLWHM